MAGFGNCGFGLCSSGAEEEEEEEEAEPEREGAREGVLRTRKKREVHGRILSFAAGRGPCSGQTRSKTSPHYRYSG